MKKFLKLLLVLTLPLTVYFSWKSFDKSYSTDDEAAYLELSQELYLNFKTDSPVTALKEMYLHRHWKPILHPLILVPLLAATNGDTRLAITIYGGLLYSLIVLIVYAFLSRYLPFEMSLIATTATALLPWVFGMSTTFNSELGFCAAFLCLFYACYGLKTYESLQRCVCAGLLLALAFCIRPVETVLLSFVGLFYSVAKTLLRGKIGRGDIAEALIFLTYFVTVLSLPFFVLERRWSPVETFAIILFGSTYLVYFVFFTSQNLREQSRNFRVFCGLFFWISLVWYVPGSHNIMDWIFVANFDYLAKETGRRLNATLVSFLLFYFQKLGVLTALMLGLFVFDSQKKIKSLFTENSLLLFGGLIAFPLLGGLLSYNGDVRYYYAGWLICTMVLFSQILQQKRRWYVARYLAVFLLAAAGLVNIFAHAAWGGLNRPYSRINIVTGESFFRLTPRSIEPFVFIASSLTNEVLSLGKPTNNLLFLKTMPHPFFDSSTLNIISRETTPLLRFAETSFFAPTKAEHILRMINTKYDFFLVGPIDIETSRAKVPTGTIAQDLAALCKSGSPSTIAGLENFRLVKKLYFEKFGEHCLYENLSAQARVSAKFH